MRTLPELESSLGFNLDRVALLFRRELVRALADFDLTPGHWQILAALSAHPDRLTQGDIATLTFKDKHSVSRMLGRMERAGWITRLVDPLDARASAVGLSRRRNELPRIRSALRSHFGRINGLLSEPQRRELLSLLKVLRSGLEEA
jgi:DNA-binding MarR family transcriptional regulator